LWFVDPETPDNLGPTTATGAVWLEEAVKADTPSESFLFTGWPNRAAWLKNHGGNTVVISTEVDKSGDGTWESISSMELIAGSSTRIDFDQEGEWVRFRADREAPLTAIFTYSAQDRRDNQPKELFTGLEAANSPVTSEGLLYGLGDDRRSLGILANYQGQPAGYYELDGAMNLLLKEDQETGDFIKSRFAIPENVVSVQEASVLVVDDTGRRWRLPKGSQAFDSLTNDARVRLSREVATERDLFNCHGTFYELPAENADGFAKIRPVSSHSYRIHDYASYRGLLVMTGIDPGQSTGNPHVIVSDDGKAAVWAGAIDDLWKMGKPIGRGGPWYQQQVSAGVPSDPYLMAFYDQKSLELSHQASGPVNVTIEVEPLGHGPWMTYKEVEVPAGETLRHQFPMGFQARWIRFVTDTDCEATAYLEYR